MQHVTVENLIDYIEGQVSTVEKSTLEGHVATCKDCGEPTMTTDLDLNLDYQLKLEPGLDRFGIGVIGAGFIIRDCHLPAYAQAGMDQY